MSDISDDHHIIYKKIKTYIRNDNEQSFEQLKNYLENTKDIIRVLEKYGPRILLYCVLNYFNESLKILLDNKININVLCNTGGFTPIRLALYHGWFGTAKLLYDYGANVDIPDNRGDTILHRSVVYYDIDWTKLILKRCNDINHVNIYNRTPLNSLFADILHHKNGDIFRKSSVKLETMILLLRYGADINVLATRELNAKQVIYRTICHEEECERIMEYPNVIPLVGMCIIIVQRYNIDRLWLPPALFKFPKLIK